MSESNSTVYKHSVSENRRIISSFLSESKEIRNIPLRPQDSFIFTWSPCKQRLSSEGVKFVVQDKTTSHKFVSTVRVTAGKTWIFHHFCQLFAMAAIHQVNNSALPPPPSQTIFLSTPYFQDLSSPCHPCSLPPSFSLFSSLVFSFCASVFCCL